MAVFEYEACDREREQFTETGTVVGRDKSDAEEKLFALNFSEVRLKRLSGFGALFKQFTADVR